MSNYDVEQIYQDFWKDIICVGNGIIDIEQVKKNSVTIIRCCKKFQRYIAKLLVEYSANPCMM